MGPLCLQARAEPKKQEKLQRKSRYIAGLLGRGCRAAGPARLPRKRGCCVPTLACLPLCLLPIYCPAEKAEERKAESDILYERQLAKERAAGARRGVRLCCWGGGGGGAGRPAVLPGCWTLPMLAAWPLLPPSTQPPRHCPCPHVLCSTEDHLFGDKEKFVTAAYRAKLAERAVWLEEQRRKCVAAAGAGGDVLQRAA